jgi:hypothetical protein
LFGDWLVYAINMATWGFEFWAVDIAGALFACVLAATAEGALASAPAGRAWLKGLIVALIVAVPLPLLGSVVALAGLAWHLVTTLARRRRAV